MYLHFNNSYFKYLFCCFEFVVDSFCLKFYFCVSRCFIFGHCNFVVVTLIPESVLLDKFIFQKMAQFGSPVKLCPSGPKKVGMVYSGRDV